MTTLLTKLSRMRGKLAELRAQRSALDADIRRIEMMTRTDTTTIVARPMTETEHAADTERIRNRKLYASQLAPYNLVAEDVIPVPADAQAKATSRLQRAEARAEARWQSLNAHNVAQPVSAAYGIDFDLTYLKPGEAFKLALGQALNIFEVEGYVDPITGSYEWRGPEKTRADGSRYRPTLGSNPHHVGDPVFYEGYEMMAVTVEAKRSTTESNYYLVVAHKHHLNGDRASDRALYARLKPSKTLARGRRAFVWHPDAYSRRYETPSAPYPFDALEDVAAKYVRELELTNSDTDHIMAAYDLPGYGLS